MTQLNSSEDKITSESVHTGMRQVETVQDLPNDNKSDSKPIGYNNKVGLSSPPPLPPRYTRPDYVPPATPKQQETPAPAPGTTCASHDDSTVHEYGTSPTRSTPLYPPGLPPRSTHPVPSTTLKQDAITDASHTPHHIPTRNTDSVDDTLEGPFAGLSLQSNLAVPLQIPRPPLPDLRSTRSLPALNIITDTPSFTRKTLTPRCEPEFTLPSAPATPSKTKAKFYTVVAGKRTGVFIDWNYVAGLVLGVPGARYKSFKTEAEAYANYNTHKRKGMVEVIRISSADDEFYGPVESAME